MRQASIYKIFLGDFFIAFSYGASLLLPLLINSIGGNEALSGKVLLFSGVGTVICVYLSKSLMRSFNAYFVAMFGGVLFAIGAFFLIFQHSINFMLFLNAFLIGGGWGLCYNAAPYCLSGLIDDSKKVKYFSYLAAFVVMGSCSSPILLNVLGKNINFVIMFSSVVVSSLLSFLCFFWAKVPTVLIKQSNENLSLMFFLKGKTKYPLIMVFLGASAFTVLMNFQATYALKYHLNYAIFFAAYSITVVAARFLLTGFIAKQNPYIAVIILVACMLFSIILFMFVPNNISLYPFAAILFGLGYGLTYPLIQGIAVNSSPKNASAEIISFFSLFYFVAVYGFPIIAGQIITSYGYNIAIIILGLIIFAELIVALKQLLNSKIAA